MNSSLLFDFSVDRENKTIRVQREFAAPRTKVWDAWTHSDLLDQWWAPKPYRLSTKEMDFRDGGHWLYAMISPEQEAHWCRADFSNIINEQSFSAKDAFCDEQGHKIPEFPSSLWHNSFIDRGTKTLVNISIIYETEEALAQILEMGFKEGFTMGLGNLDELLASS